ncbi:MAG TPA: hypothetical protein VIF81_07585 [Pyrinomonadaceae bacterium]
MISKSLTRPVAIAIAKKLGLRIVALLTLIAATVVVCAAATYYMGDGGGWTYWLSCGSSAGNFYYKCDGGGNCQACDTGPCQESADEQCGMREPPLIY